MGVMKESIQRAFSYIQAKKSKFSIARDQDMLDLHVEAIDRLGNRAESVSLIWRLLQRKAEHVVLLRPFGRQGGEAGNAHSMG